MSRECASGTTTAPARPLGRALIRAFPVCVAAWVFVLAAVELALMAGGRLGSEYGGTDIHQYLDATRRWIASGSPYLPSEVLGPFDFASQTYLHPPLGLYLFAPFTVLPLVLWWAIPIAIVCLVVVSWRPDRWAWPLIALCLLWPRSPASLVVGNTDMWVAAALALGLRSGWPAVLVAVKPSFAPLMLAGAGARSWWIALAIVGLAAVPFGDLWLEWLAVISNAPADVTYSVLSLPLVLVPVIAWLRRTRRRASVHAPSLARPRVLPWLAARARGWDARSP